MGIMWGISGCHMRKRDLLIPGSPPGFRARRLPPAQALVPLPAAPLPESNSGSFLEPSGWVAVLHLFRRFLLRLQTLQPGGYTDPLCLSLDLAIGLNLWPGHHHGMGHIDTDQCA